MFMDFDSGLVCNVVNFVLFIFIEFFVCVVDVYGDCLVIVYGLVC